MPTKKWRLLAASAKVRSLATAATDLQKQPERGSEWRSGMGHSVLWGKRAKLSADNQVLSGDFTRPGLAFLHRTARKSLTETSAPPEEKPASAKTNVCPHVPPSTKIIRNTDLLPTSFWCSFSKLSECCLSSSSPHFAPDKILNNSHVLLFILVDK